jgi:hypothetical protein
MRQLLATIAVCLVAVTISSDSHPADPLPVKLPPIAPVPSDLASDAIITKAAAKLKKRLAELAASLPAAQRQDPLVLAHQGLLAQLRRADAVREAFLTVYPNFIPKVTELRWMRRGLFLDPTRCVQKCTKFKPVCVPDLTRCNRPEPPTCEETCVDGPQVCVDDLTNCTAGQPRTCEQKCTPSGQWCGYETYDCGRWGCKTRWACHDLPQVCGDDLTRCTGPTEPSCAKTCTTPRVCAKDLTKCDGGTAPVCEQICKTPPPLCTPNCVAKNPINTGYNPAAALTATGRQALLTKVRSHEQAIAGRHFADGLMRHVRVDPDTLVNGLPRVTSTDDSVRNASGFTGLYLAAVAYKYGVTRAPADLDKLIEVLTGVYYLTTMASAPIPGDTMALAGSLIHKDTCKVLQDPSNPKSAKIGRSVNATCTLMPRKRSGVWLRSLYVGWDDATEAREDARGTSWGNYTWGFQASTPVTAFPLTCGRGETCRAAPQRFHFEADQSRDNVDYLMFGLAAAHEVLTLTNQRADWRQRISLVVLDFMRTLIANGWKLIDLDGTEPEWGNETVWPPDGDPTNMIEVLGWLKIAIQITGDQGLRKEYLSKVNNHILGNTYESVFRAFELPAAAFLRDWPELMELGIWPIRYRPAELMVVFHMLMRYENDPALRTFYLAYFDRLLYPMVKRNRVPLFDSMFLAAHMLPDAAIDRLDGLPESMRGRIAGVLAQYRAAPFGVKPTTPAALAGCAIEHRFHTDYSGCRKLSNPLAEVWNKAKDRFGIEQGNEDYLSIWPLGWGITYKTDAMWDAGATYALTSIAKNQDPTNPHIEPSTFIEPSTYDYLLQYWFARYHGSLAGP